MPQITVILQMDGDYPNISSGVVSFENANTGTKVSIKAVDLASGAHGIKSIVMDTGAGYTTISEG